MRSSYPTGLDFQNLTTDDAATNGGGGLSSNNPIKTPKIRTRFCNEDEFNLVDETQTTSTCTAMINARAMDTKYYIYCFLVYIIDIKNIMHNIYII